MSNEPTPQIADRRERHEYELALDGKPAPSCSYVASWMGKHPEYQALVIQR